MNGGLSVREPFEYLHHSLAILWILVFVRQTRSYTPGKSITSSGPGIFCRIRPQGAGFGVNFISAVMTLLRHWKIYLPYRRLCNDNLFMLAGIFTGHRPLTRYPSSRRSGYTHTYQITFWSDTKVLRISRAFTLDKVIRYNFGCVYTVPDPFLIRYKSVTDQPCVYTRSSDPVQFWLRLHCTRSRFDPIQKCYGSAVRLH